MYKYFFLLPVYNDWKSLNKLLTKLNNFFKKEKKKIDIIIVNDSSTFRSSVKKNKLNYIGSIKIINLKKNLGSQKSIAVGIKYLSKLRKKSIITIMDADGEDDYTKVKKMINCAIKNENCIVTSNRTERKEPIIFKILYKIHLLIIFLFSGKWISFGNFTSLNNKNLKNLQSDESIWFAYSAGVSKNCKTFQLPAKRKHRFYGKSKVSFAQLMFHSLRIAAVFNYYILFTSCIYVSILYLFFYIFEAKFLIFLSFLIIMLNLFIFFTRALFKKDEYNLRSKFIKNIETIN